MYDDGKLNLFYLFVPQGRYQFQLYLPWVAYIWNTLQYWGKCRPCSLTSRWSSLKIAHRIWSLNEAVGSLLLKVGGAGDGPSFIEKCAKRTMILMNADLTSLLGQVNKYSQNRLMWLKRTLWANQDLIAGDARKWRHNTSHL